MRKIVGDRIRVNRSTGLISSEISIATAKPCQVHAEIDDDGNVKMGCASVTCDGTCNLKENLVSGETEYWCTCD